MTKQDMRKTLLSAVLLFAAVSAGAQLKMREVFAQLPDSVLPLMSRNNRLDCIDFIENGMEARVKNRFDDYATLDTLTANFLSLRTGGNCTVEMKLVPLSDDTLICVNRTYSGPAEDSEVRLYGMDWKFVRVVQRPEVEEFLKSPDSIRPRTQEMADTMDMIRTEAAFLPLMKASLSGDNTQIVWTLQTTEFGKETKRVAGRYLQPVRREAARRQ